MTFTGFTIASVASVDNESNCLSPPAFPLQPNAIPNKRKISLSTLFLPVTVVNSQYSETGRDPCSEIKFTTSRDETGDDEPQYGDPFRPNEAIIYLISRTSHPIATFTRKGQWIRQHCDANSSHFPSR
ncbi:hypothetical protein AVEN_72512-1 [Araneus ventricosus]|uniref:Uncharacterized protein n=1 Tax=Araneus ventricosus TaxID=182803 RepID=A0A4Y2G4U1_ARAVE|nr:hypothetical protein AVEN_72512-1 [Araneus ventricosus]